LASTSGKLFVNAKLVNADAFFMAIIINLEDESAETLEEPIDDTDKLELNLA
jgi:hypothetical protein